MPTLSHIPYYEIILLLSLQSHFCFTILDSTSLCSTLHFYMRHTVASGLHVAGFGVNTALLSSPVARLTANQTHTRKIIIKLLQCTWVTAMGKREFSHSNRMSIASWSGMGNCHVPMLSLTSIEDLSTNCRKSSKSVAQLICISRSIGGIYAD